MSGELPKVGNVGKAVLDEEVWASSSRALHGTLRIFGFNSGCREPLTISNYMARSDLNFRKDTQKTK